MGERGITLTGSETDHRKGYGVPDMGQNILEQAEICSRNEQENLVAVQISEERATEFLRGSESEKDNAVWNTAWLEEKKAFLRETGNHFLLAVWGEHEEKCLLFLSDTKRVRPLEFLDYLIPDFGLIRGTEKMAHGFDGADAPALPMRPPVLCAGCPHRASFYAVKQAMKGKKAYFCGDIGCYTLGNAMPLDMVDTCLCMGAGITMAQGFHWIDGEGTCFGFVGDSTFFASGMTGVVNAVYNNADMILCVLDNSTTAMTGHQPHPGIGRNMMGQFVDKVDIAKVLEGIGVHKIITVDPLDLAASVAAVQECDKLPGVKAIIFKSPCIAISKPDGKCRISEQCINCKKCIREIGCPALITVDGNVTIDENLCTGCGLCSQICPVHAIGDDTQKGGATS